MNSTNASIKVYQEWIAKAIFHVESEKLLTSIQHIIEHSTGSKMPGTTGTAPNVETFFPKMTKNNILKSAEDAYEDIHKGNGISSESMEAEFGQK